MALVYSYTPLSKFSQLLPTVKCAPNVSLLDLMLTILALSGELFLCLQFSFLNCIATRFCSFLADCRRSLPLSPQLQAKVRPIFLHLPKPPYLCAQLINSINIKNLKIMVQKNEMSARALTMEEMENVNGGRRRRHNRRIPVRRQNNSILQQ